MSDAKKYDARCIKLYTRDHEGTQGRHGHYRCVGRYLLISFNEVFVFSYGT